MGGGALYDHAPLRDQTDSYVGRSCRLERGSSNQSLKAYFLEEEDEGTYIARRLEVRMISCVNHRSSAGAIYNLCARFVTLYLARLLTISNP